MTEYSIVLSAAALPLTYFPILVIANDPAYMGDEHTNGRLFNVIASVYLVILVVVSIATDPPDDHHEGRIMTDGRVLHAALHLLDRQMRDRDGDCAGRSTISSWNATTRPAPST